MASAAFITGTGWTVYETQHAAYVIEMCPAMFGVGAPVGSADPHYEWWPCEVTEAGECECAPARAAGSCSDGAVCA